MTAALSVAAAVVLSASLYAQAKPNFSGKWIQDAEKTAAANPAMAGRGGGGGGGRMGGGGAPAPQTFTMDATMLKIERAGQDGTMMTTTYKLDGSESKNMQMGRGGQTEVVSKATIDGNKVVIKTQGANGETVQSWYMDGEWLVNERAFGENTIKTYYKKAS